MLMMIVSAEPTQVNLGKVCEEGSCLHDLLLLLLLQPRARDYYVLCTMALLSVNNVIKVESISRH
jgi:hypothetical protein